MAVKVVVWPSQITVFPVTATVKVFITLTVAVTEVEATQPSELPITA